VFWPRPTVNPGRPLPSNPPTTTPSTQNCDRWRRRRGFCRAAHDTTGMSFLLVSRSLPPMILLPKKSDDRKEYDVTEAAEVGGEKGAPGDEALAAAKYGHCIRSAGVGADPKPLK